MVAPTSSYALYLITSSFIEGYITETLIHSTPGSHFLGIIMLNTIVWFVPFNVHFTDKKLKVARDVTTITTYLK